MSAIAAVSGLASAVSGVTGVSGVSGAVGPSATGGASGASGTSFANVLGQGLESLESSQNTADNLSIQAATGTLTNAHDLMIATAQAQLTTQLTVAIRDKAVAAFNEIMGMQI